MKTVQCDRRNDDSEAAQQYLLASAAKYGESLRWNPNNPQVGIVHLRSVLHSWVIARWTASRFINLAAALPGSSVQNDCSPLFLRAGAEQLGAGAARADCAAAAAADHRRNTLQN